MINRKKFAVGGIALVFGALVYLPFALLVSYFIGRVVIGEATDEAFGMLATIAMLLMFLLGPIFLAIECDEW